MDDLNAGFMMRYNGVGFDQMIGCRVWNHASVTQTWAVQKRQNRTPLVVRRVRTMSIGIANLVFLFQMGKSKYSVRRERPAMIQVGPQRRSELLPRHFADVLCVRVRKNVESMVVLWKKGFSHALAVVCIPSEKGMGIMFPSKLARSPFKNK